MTKRERERLFNDYTKRGARELADLMVRSDEYAEKQEKIVSAVRSYCRRERAGVDVGEPQMAADWVALCRMVGVRTNG